MNETKKLKIELRGHTDNKGSDDYNLKLLQKRIDSVKNYLVEHGINSDSRGKRIWRSPTHSH